MSAQIDQDLKSSGIAQVIVMLRGPGPSAAAAADAAPSGTVAAAGGGPVVQALAPHFRHSELSQTSALAAVEAGGRPLRAAARAGRVPGGADGAPRPAPVPPPARYYPNLGVMLGTVDRQGLAALRQEPQVSAVFGTPPISLIRPSRVATASLTRKVTWGVRMMRVPALWNQGFTGTGILIGHLDTGVDGEHPALRQAIEAFSEFDDFGREVTPAPAPFDTDDHGTHTAATIAGRPIGERHIGVAHGAKLASAIVIEGGDVIARVLGGMDWAVGKNVRILNMSLGFRGFWEDFIPLTQILRARNILPVFAVGNEGPGTSRSPGNYPEALSVGAHDSEGQVADFSSSQEFARGDDRLVPDLVAPGVGTISARPGGGFQSMDGSSMATPHIAGLAALLMSAKPEKSAAQVEAAIFQSCKLPAGVLPARANRGIPDAVDALALL